MIPSQDTSHNIAGRRSSSEGDMSQAPSGESGTSER